MPDTLSEGNHFRNDAESNIAVLKTLQDMEKSGKNTDFWNVLLELSLERKRKIDQRVMEDIIDSLLDRKYIESVRKSWWMPEDQRVYRLTKNGSNVLNQ